MRGFLFLRSCDETIIIFHGQISQVIAIIKEFLRVIHEHMRDISEVEPLLQQFCTMNPRALLSFRQEITQDLPVFCQDLVDLPCKIMARCALVVIKIIPA